MNASHVWTTGKEKKSKVNCIEITGISKVFNLIIVKPKSVALVCKIKCVVKFTLFIIISKALQFSELIFD